MTYSVPNGPDYGAHTPPKPTVDVLSEVTSSHKGGQEGPSPREPPFGLTDIVTGPSTMLREGELPAGCPLVTPTYTPPLAYGG